MPVSRVPLAQQEDGQGQGDRGVAAQHSEAGPRRQRIVAVERRVGAADLRVLRSALLDGEGGGRGDPQHPVRWAGGQDGGDHREDVREDAALTAAPAAGDQGLAESLVANLVDNALRHNVAGGRAEISTTTTTGRATISVSNTGTVIPPDEVGRLFQPFQQLGTERIRHAGAHGLGLAIVHAIASAHRATATARARADGGLDVDVIFPVSEFGDLRPFL